MEKVNQKYRSKSHCKFLLKYPVIFVVKFRHNLLSNPTISSFVKKQISDIRKNYGYLVDTMEDDGNHIHILLDLEPSQAISNVVKTIKSITTIELWKNHENILKKKLWGTRQFWTSGYFVCTTGDACTETIREYINNQG